MLSPFFQNFFELLIANAYREDFVDTTSDLGLASFTALSALCESAGKEVNDVLFSMLLPILMRIEETLNP